MKKSSLSGALLACLWLAAVNAHAQSQLYRCERDGRISYSDVPCEAGAKASQTTYASSTAATGTLDFQVGVKTYEVVGRDYESLRLSLRARGPSGFHGLAKWRVTYQYTTKRERELCQITTVVVRIAGEILMPHWVDQAKAPAQLQRQWDQYYAALKTHEDGHIQHGRELALLVKERLLGLSAAPCDQMQALAQGEFDRLYGNLRTRDKEYDARTNHGETQGASFRRLREY